LIVGLIGLRGKAPETALCHPLKQKLLGWLFSDIGTAVFRNYSARRSFKQNQLRNKCDIEHTLQVRLAITHGHPVSHFYDVLLILKRVCVERDQYYFTVEWHARLGFAMVLIDDSSCYCIVFG
jgi:hypothetical protein